MITKGYLVAARAAGLALSVMLAGCSAGASPEAPVGTTSQAVHHDHDIPVPAGVITSCFNEDDGEIRLIDPAVTKSCRHEEHKLTWNQTGPKGDKGDTGPKGDKGDTGPKGDKGDAGVSNVYMNRNFQDVTLAAFPGVTVASLSLPAGSYIITAKFRYRGHATGGTASCVYQGTGIGGLDASQNNAPAGGETSGQVDGYMMDFVTKNAGDPADVHVQCFGPADVSIINTQFVALPTGITFQ